MNSEELELSLRSEFENHIKAIVAEMKQEASEYQQKVDAELEKHKIHLDEAFQSFLSRIETERGLDQAFSETVVEYLRLSRDEGARITADAMAEAEKMSPPEAAPPRLDNIREAVNEISAQSSQSSILHSLIKWAGEFTQRGAFFIVRNEHLLGWHAIGSGGPDDERVRQISFSVEENSILGEAVRSLKPTSRGAAEGDRVFLEPLGFGDPSSALAVPLVARGRGVAVLYVDGGEGGQEFNRDALEMLVRVASLTVELLASNQTPRPAVAVRESYPAVHEAPAQEISSEYPRSDLEYSLSQEKPSQFEARDRPEDVVEAGIDHFEAEALPEAVEIAEQGHVAVAEVAEVPHAVEAEVIEEIIEAETVYADAEVEATTDFAFVPADAPVLVSEVAKETVPIEDVAAAGNGHVVEQAAVPSASRSERRLGERKIDLPIEVSEEERNPHTKARRFARLLVSEIKLYNEQKVKDGREAGDLYERLREAIDRSREMYDKRVEPPVATRFDYFHYELVNDLAQGDESRLGGGYPGAAV